MEKSRQLIYFKDYYWDFFNKLEEKVKDKIDYVLFLVTVADRIPKKFFEPMTGYEGLFEIRVEFESNIYRIFCCLTKEIWSCFSMDFKRKHKGLLKTKLRKQCE